MSRIEQSRLVSCIEISFVSSVTVCMAKPGKQKQKKTTSSSSRLPDSRGRSDARVIGGAKRHDLQQRRKPKPGAMKVKDEETRDEINGNMETLYSSLHAPKPPEVPEAPTGLRQSTSTEHSISLAQAIEALSGITT